MSNRLSDRMLSLRDWVDARFPLMHLWEDHLTKYYAPKNLNFWYYFGSLAMLVLVIQIVTGIFLTMNYKPTAETAFASVEYIMRDVNWGWLIRYLHSTGASFFFIVVYLHMFRGLLYGSYRGPRELLWVIGMGLFVVLMAEAFMGYLLPWGQMSFWGAQVIISLFGAIPYIGEDLALRCPSFSGFQQSRWHRNQEEEGTQWRSAGRHSLPPLLHRKGYGGCGRVPHHFRGSGVLRPRDGRLLP